MLNPNFLTALVAAAFLTLPACNREGDQAGEDALEVDTLIFEDDNDLEEAGEAIGEGIEETGEAIKEGVEETGEAIDEGAEKVNR